MIKVRRQVKDFQFHLFFRHSFVIIDQTGFYNFQNLFFKNESCIAVTGVSCSVFYGFVLSYILKLVCKFSIQTRELKKQQYLLKNHQA